MNEENEVQFWLESPDEAFLEWAESCNYSNTTVKAYSRIFSKLIEFLSSNGINLKNVNNTVYRKFLNNITDSEKSRNIYSNQMLSLFNHLSDIGLIEQNPSATRKTMKKGRSEKKLPVSLTNDETKRFIENIIDVNGVFSWEKLREATILRILLETGARCSEVAKLKTGAVTTDSPAKIRFYGKGRKEREVPIGETLARMLEHFIDIRGSRSGPYLFANSHGEPPTGMTIYKMVRRTMDRAGIVKEKMGPHTLRHTFATRQFEAGIPAAIIKNWMGHSSLATTLIYEHVSIVGGSVKPV